MSQNKEFPSKILLGINQDIHPAEQPKETIRFALNAIKEDTEGNYNNYQSEPSNKRCFSLLSNYNFIGSIYLEKGDKIVFATDNITSRILLVSNNCHVTELVSSTCLNFNKDFFITGEFRVRKGCNRVIYYSDNLNPDRFLDLDDLDSFKDIDGDWDCSLMTLTPTVTLPEVEVLSVEDSGGNLKVGSYSFAVELLDNNFNSIDYGTFTPHIPVYDGNSSQEYSSIVGNLPSPQFLSEVGGVETTSKSFNLRFKNLDQSFQFARLIVLYRGTSFGEVETAYRIDNFIPINSGTVDITFSNLQDAILDDASKYKVPKIKYSSSNVIEQVQNRLVRAGTKEQNRDYSFYQRLVNNISVNYEVTRSEPFNAQSLGNPKNLLTYAEGSTWIGDEVEALGVEFIFKDGSISPTFHIPGRSATNIDNQILTVGADILEEDVAHLNLVNGNTIERWKYENTAELISQTNPRPKLGYFETNTTYPETLDCDGERIYGELAGSPIRHHKIPCRSLIPAQIESAGELFNQRLALRFDNIEYPDPDIVGHRFLKATRTDNNATVIDTAIIVPWLNSRDDSDELYFFNEFFQNSTTGISYTLDDETVALVSSKILSGKSSRTDYIKYLSSYNYSPSTPEVATDRIVIGGDFGNNNLTQSTKIYWNYETSLSLRYRNIINQKNIAPNSSFQSTNFDKLVLNRNLSNTIKAVSLNHKTDLLFNPLRLNTALLKRNIIPYTNLFNIKYHPITPVLTLDELSISYQGEGFLNNLDIFSITDVQTSSSQWNYRVEARYLSDVFVDSDINYNLKVDGTDCNTVYVDDREQPRGFSQEGISSYAINKVAIFNNNNWDTLRPSPCKEYYRFNDDYSPKHPNSGIVIPITFQYCSKCLTDRPNRLIFSPVSFNEEISDYYRVTLADDYIDLPFHRGRITGLKYKNNKLYVHTDQTTFILQPNPQFINTDQNTAYINTGDFLSIPPYEIMQTDLGYGGLQNKLAVSNSEFGYVWFDVNTGKLLQLSDTIRNLSNKGLTQWFKEHSPFKLNTFFKERLNQDYNFNDSRINTSITFDPRFERVLINKKDYSINLDNFGAFIPATININKLEENKLYIDQDSHEFHEVVLGQLTTVSLTNEKYFYNAGWVLSFSFKHDSFISYHSYLSDIMFNDNLYFYTTKNNTIYQHLHDKSYSKYFDTQYPFIIEFVANDYSTDLVKSIQYYAEFFKETSLVDNINYNNLIVYNSNQSTGKLVLQVNDQTTNPYSALSLSPSLKTIVERNKNFMISNLWDYSTNNKVVTKDFSEIQSEFLLNGYIDKIPANIDYGKTSYESGELRDKYAIIRLFYYPEQEDVKAVHIFSNVSKLIAI